MMRTLWIIVLMLALRTVAYACGANGNGEQCFLSDNLHGGECFNGGCIATYLDRNEFGGGAFPGTGTISSSAQVVTGSGTVFTVEVAVGDVIVAAGQTAVVISVDTLTLLSTFPAFSPALPAGTTFTLQQPIRTWRNSYNVKTIMDARHWLCTGRVLGYCASPLDILNSLFRVRENGDVNVSGNVTVRSVNYTWPGSNAVGVFKDDGAGALSWAPVAGSDFATQTANTVLAGPTSGGAATPTFRALVAADLPTAEKASGPNGAVQLSDGSGAFVDDDASFHWDRTNHRLLIGTTTSQGLFLETAGSQEVVRDGSGTLWRVMTQYGGAGTFDLQQAAAGSKASPTALGSGVAIAHYNAMGHDGTVFGQPFSGPDAAINMVTDGAFTTSSHPTRIEEVTTASSSVASRVVRTADNAGNQKFLGKFTQYNNINTVSNGVPSELGQINTTGLTANVASATLYAVPAASGGLYRVSALVVETTAASVSSTLPNVQIIYTDVDTNGSVTIDATPVLGVAGTGQTGALTANTVGTTATGVIIVDAKASTNINYQTVNYASTAAGMAYAVHLRLEAL